MLRVVQEESRRNHKRLLTTNPHFRAKVSARVKAYFHAHKHEEAYVRGKSISRWCFCMPDKSKSAWVRENLPWKTHLPHHQSERSYHFYSCCGISRYMKTGVSGRFLIIGYSLDTYERVTKYISDLVAIKDRSRRIPLPQALRRARLGCSNGRRL